MRYYEYCVIIFSVGFEFGNFYYSLITPSTNASGQDAPIESKRRLLERK